MATWNINTWNNKAHEILEALNNHKIDICVLAETKKKGRGNKSVGNYTLWYSGKQQNERAKSGVGILIHRRLKDNIENVEYIDHNIILMTLNFRSDKTHVIGIYAPDTSKAMDEREAFYQKLDETINTLDPKSKIFIIGDTNARIGNRAIPGIMNRFGEEAMNDNGHLLLNLCMQNELRINNTYFVHSDSQKYTFENTRQQRSIIDHIITNKNVHPNKIIDVRALPSANIGTEHQLIMCKYRIKVIKGKQKQVMKGEKFNIESLKSESTKGLFETRLKTKILNNPIQTEDSIDQGWQKIKENIINTATEAIGLRTTSDTRHRNYKPWYNPELKMLAREKRIAYNHYKTNRTPENYDKYRRARRATHIAVRALKNQYWETFSLNLQHDLYGCQKIIWKMLRKHKKGIDEEHQIDHINPNTWAKYFQNLYDNGEKTTTEDMRTDPDLPTIDDDNWTITQEELSAAIKTLKGRKAPGIDLITNEILRAGGPQLEDELWNLFNKNVKTGKIPQDWKTTITIPIYKKGDKNNPDNYRGITLINSTAKLFTKTIAKKINTNMPFRDEQQGFRQSRSTIDAIFVVRQIVEKSIEFAKPAFLCFVDLSKAFDNIRVSDVVNVLTERGAGRKLTNIIKDLNTNNKTKVKTPTHISETVPITDGIRQGDSMSPTLFNLIMDKIIGKVKQIKAGYRMGRESHSIICYADDALLMAETEDDLQRLLQTFARAAKDYNLQVSAEKTKCLVSSKHPIRCKLQLGSHIIEQVMSFNYLGVEVTSDRQLTKEVVNAANKARRISGALNNIIWRNKYLSQEAKTRVYKTAVRPVLTYAVETRADTAITKQIYRTTEMRTLRAIKGVTLRDHVRSHDIRQELEVQDIACWARVRRRQWRDHVERMTTQSITHWAMTAKPMKTRPLGRPPKRWSNSMTSKSQENTGET